MTDFCLNKKSYCDLTAASNLYTSWLKLKSNKRRCEYNETDSIVIKKSLPYKNTLKSIQNLQKFTWSKKEKQWVKRTPFVDYNYSGEN